MPVIKTDSGRSAPTAKKVPYLSSLDDIEDSGVVIKAAGR